MVLASTSNTFFSFDQWKLDYGITYETISEERQRKNVWEENVRKFGVNALNPYTDLRPDECHYPSIEEIFPLSDETKYPTSRK